MNFLTVKTKNISEIEVKRSRFIAHLVPIGRFDETLVRCREEHRKANHHVTAFRQIMPTNQIEEGAKDDGEPAGTSGMPVLKTLTGANLIDVGIIVTRYFGGTKLGTGGLARAYSGAAKQAIDEAKLIPWVRIIQSEVEFEFSQSSEFERQLGLYALEVISRDFHEDGVRMTVRGPEDKVKAFEVFTRQQGR